ncbi:hypothetical protein NQ317_012001 [Molorchus minor]|uniref:Protein masquerade clip-domain domain-containing protein n=1 Tax=Molorchus minor TaxID=1323400 RepID=A0ABQ9K1X9_9CUCU|nr:hypothetical protein NQ317_012001 [Molorchus minor]
MIQDNCEAPPASKNTDDDIGTHGHKSHEPNYNFQEICGVGVWYNQRSSPYRRRTVTKVLDAASDTLLDYYSVKSAPRTLFQSIQATPELNDTNLKDRIPRNKEVVTALPALAVLSDINKKRFGERYTYSPHQLVSHRSHCKAYAYLLTLSDELPLTECAVYTSVFSPSAVMCRTRDVLLLLLFFLGVQAQDDSLAGSFLSGLLDTITSTEDAKDCPGVCVHTFATIICYEVLDNITCPSSSMKCCVEPGPTEEPANTTIKIESTTMAITTMKTTTTSSTPSTTTTTLNQVTKSLI